MSSKHQSDTGAKGVLKEKAPAFSTEQAADIAQRLFDIQATAQPLTSERDQNFHLRAKDGLEWVLKIANPAEDPANLDMQAQALLHIAQVDPDLAIPRVKTTTGGDLHGQIPGHDGRRFIVRVLSGSNA
jgi:Ser/Thr protein kinase RdoA (MazF antagonist)